VTVLLRVSTAGRGVVGGGVVLAVLPTADWVDLVREDDCASGLADVVAVDAPASTLDSRGVGGDWDASAGCVSEPAVGNELPAGDALVSVWVSAACDGVVGTPGAGPGPAAGAVSTVPG